MLRPYQQSAISAVISSLSAGETPILVSPTGSGKTYAATELIRTLARQTLWLAHRTELIDQAADRLRLSGLTVGVIKAGRPLCLGAEIQVASVQTLVRRSLSLSHTLTVIDEAHHARSDGYQKILGRYPSQVVGLTATPFRLDGKGLGPAGFTKIIVAAHTDDLVRDGVLIEPRVFAPPGPSMRGVHIRAGDYAEEEVAEIMDKPRLVADIVETWKKRVGIGTPARNFTPRTVCYAVNVEHSRHIVAAFQTAGIQFEHLDGSTPRGQRFQILTRLRAGEIAGVSNCMVLTEGWDLPALEYAIIARPTASKCLHLQMIGRIMRAAEGKTGAVVLDHAGNTMRLGTVTDRIDYDLNDRIRPPRTATTERFKSCPECWALCPTAASKCHECGHAFVCEKIPDTTPGELVEVVRPIIVRSGSHTEQVEVLREMVRQQNLFGYRVGYAAAKFRDRFGTWPPQSVVRDAER